MNFSNGLYLDNEICAFCNNWLIVYDGKYNHMLFNTGPKAIERLYKQNRMPSNSPCSKQVEYYSSFDNAVDNLVKVVANGGIFLNDGC